MFKNKLRAFFLFFLMLIILTLNMNASDWPIYKGNLYFTGNNDEIIVKNNRLKWLYQADDRVFNPIASEGRLYFIDLKNQLYCLDEDSGKLIWKININSIASRFRAGSSASSKIKYPLIKGDLLILTDSVAIYALNKKTGIPLWARSAFRQSDLKSQGRRRGIRLFINGIYSNPIISEDQIIYGTRNFFIARSLNNGHLSWDNQSIKSYNGFPVFYDKYILTQSRDYRKNTYSILCLQSKNGQKVWETQIQRPFKILPPVIYKKKVYVPSQKTLYCLDLKTGETLWQKEYPGIINSALSFTDRSILFTLNNEKVYIVSPKNGESLQIIEAGSHSRPRYVTIRDQIYLAYNKKEDVSNGYNYAYVKALTFENSSKAIWQFKSPFPGAVSQPSASKGILFLPAGNYIYAIGAKYYPRIIEGGEGHIKKQNRNNNTQEENTRKNRRYYYNHQKRKQENTTKPVLKMRSLKVLVTDKQKNPLSSSILVQKYDKNQRLIYSKRHFIDRETNIEVPQGNIKITGSSGGFVPKTVNVTNTDTKKTIVLERIESGINVVIDNIYFEFNKAYLKRESLPVLDSLIEMMKKNPLMIVEVQGYTDNKGSATYNRKLSEKRADAVCEYMIKNGISPERLRSVGLGEQKPVASNLSKEGRSKNRRTEFYIIRK